MIDMESHDEKTAKLSMALMEKFMAEDVKPRVALSAMALSMGAIIQYMKREHDVDVLPEVLEEVKKKTQEITEEVAK